MYISTAQGHEHLWHEAEKLNHDHLDLLIDATRLDYPLVEELASLADGPQLAKLFDNTPEAAIADSGPLLRLTAQQQPWLKSFISTVRCNQYVLALLSPWRFNALAAHLSHYTQAHWSRGHEQGVRRHLFHRQMAACQQGLQEPLERRAFIRQWLLDNSPLVVDE
ncbi:DUF4123 domain-containing protein [Pseudomonas protegens]|uniref:DUF4123 domain-containing protein n=1 Tax=Pseudomonas protegens TaxID=380021 RepID=UPI001B30B0B8|nr:DUF4123 domain-containing protein [Pseudomonas protegens]MBP5117361.1 DUF4123 domain-containing protein [Pseudomonas protegens]QTU22206.1 DUF4123 domain-containing protein [Pseudomonas protegens]